MVGPPAEGHDKEPLRIVVADDDEDTRLLLAESLEDEPSFELVAAGKDADEAIALVTEHGPDVVILDWAMPGGGGSRAAEEIKSSHPDVAIVALTGMDAMEASYSMMSAGAVAFLQKGCSTQELLDAIRLATRW